VLISGLIFSIMSNDSITSLNPSWLNKGDNAWQLTAASLVAFQSVPGLVILYAGIVKRKWAVNSAFMAFYAFAAVLICWVLWAYKAAFGKKMLPFVGVPGPVLTMDDELRQAILPSTDPLITANFPLSTMGEFFSFTLRM
jgi:Amt family ammonium transporter